jgi:NAD(P)-dependent dehydrogenase (short-subunit alcohol dehydrogenase family)
MKTKFKDRVAVITGAGSGIGRALAIELARRGASLALLDVKQQDLEETLQLANAPRANFWVCDVTDQTRCKVVFDEILDVFGRVDFLFNNAGISHHSLTQKTQIDVLKKVMDVNFYGSVHCTLAILPELRKQKGSVVVMSSVAGFAPLFGRSAYSASKHALHGWFETLRSEEPDLHVMMVCPSFVQTAIDQNALSGDGKVGTFTKPTIGQPTSPEAIARAVCDALATRQSTLLPTPVARVAWWLARLSPTAYERVMRSKQSQGYETR